MRNIGIDVVYLVERNDPDAHDQLVSVADQLDFAWSLFPMRAESYGLMTGNGRLTMGSCIISSPLRPSFPIRTTRLSLNQ